MTLKELTSAKHKLAEDHRFTKLLLSGQISKDVYASFLANQLCIYETLENCAKNLINDIVDINRSFKIKQDWQELNCNTIVYACTKNYCTYIKSLDDFRLLAHIYVKHMGDMYGGQVIKKLIPGAGTMYDFTDRQIAIKKLREKLSVTMADEANIAFDYALELLDVISDEHNI